MKPPLQMFVVHGLMASKMHLGGGILKGACSAHVD